MDLPLKNRRDAGRQLAAKLEDLKGRDDLFVLGLPRGGVPVAYEVAVALDAPLDAYIVRKLGVPGHEELAMGAIATGDVRVLNDEVISEDKIDQGAIDAVTAREMRELHRRERLYRGTQPAPNVRDRIVILVDDGLATGTTMRAAVDAVQQLGPKEIIIAVPVAAPSVCRAFKQIVDRIVCGETPESFYALGLWYEDFAPTSDDEVRSLLAEAARRPELDAPSNGRHSLRSNGSAPSLPEAIAVQAQSLPEKSGDYDALLAEIGDSRLVLIGEATHGTEEFYAERAVITRRLIEERGFQAVAIEADWPDAFRLNRFVRDTGDDSNAEQALADFRRFPQWMWRNTVVREFIGWLHDYNASQRDEKKKVGFYGLDLYSLNASIQAVIVYLEGRSGSR